MHADYILILIILAVLVPWRSRNRIRTLVGSNGLTARERVSLYLSTITFQWLACIIIGWRLLVHRAGLANIGLSIRGLRQVIVVAIVVSIPLALNQILGVKRLANLSVEKRGFIGQIAEKLLPRTRREKCAAVALVLTVAICEEFIYRGFIEYLFQEWTASSLAGAAISAAFFAIAHLYQGRRGIITTFIIGLVFSGARIWTGSLIPSIVIHFTIDFTGGLASLRLLAATSGQ
jgi:uncharacterized protein